MSDPVTVTPTGSRSESPADLRNLLLAQKTELISELTSATANQFNNIMMAITSYAELEMKKASPSQRRSLEQVLSNAGRATTLVQKLLSVSRKLTAAPQPLELSSVIAGVRDLLEQLMGERVSLVCELDPMLPMVNADSAEIEYIVLSLAIKARNAMPSGGTLTVRTALVDGIDESADLAAGEQAGEYVVLCIEDSGRTDAIEDRGDRHDQDARVNLSLAAVGGIVRNAGGYVRFTSDPGKGSRVKICFPVRKENARRNPKRRSPRNVPVARTILVVEDDDAVRIPTTEFLKMEGFKVLQARTGEEAIYLVQQNRSRLDVLITDIVMPRMSGRQVAEKLLDLPSDLKVLYMSGDSDQAQLPMGTIVPRTRSCASRSGWKASRTGSMSCSESSGPADRTRARRQKIRRPGLMASLL